MNGTTEHEFDSIPSCVEAFGKSALIFSPPSPFVSLIIAGKTARGEFLIVFDSPSRENEGDLIISARHLTPSKAAFMIRYTSGYLCAPMSSARAKLLDLPPMVPMTENADPNRTAYCITVDAVAGAVQELGIENREDTTTGISANDRAVTCNVLASNNARAGHLRRPGHVVPLTARDGGVRVRRGHTEAGYDFARLAKIEPAVAVIGEMVVDGEEYSPSREGQKIPELRDSGMMRMQQCLDFGRKWGIRCCTIEDLAKHVENMDDI